MVQSGLDGNHFVVVFYATDRGEEPVRAWLKSLLKGDRRIIGEDIKTVQYGFPIGMPLVEKVEEDLWEVRSRLPRKIARVIFAIDRHHMILLHGFIKKSGRIPKDDLDLARRRLRQLRG